MAPRRRHHMQEPSLELAAKHPCTALHRAQRELRRHVDGQTAQRRVFRPRGTDPADLAHPRGLVLDRIDVLHLNVLEEVQDGILSTPARDTLRPLTTCAKTKSRSLVRRMSRRAVVAFMRVAVVMVGGSLGREI